MSREILQAVAGIRVHEPQEFVVYQRPEVRPPLDLEALASEVFVGSARTDHLRTPVTGDASILLRYRQKEAAVSSFSLGDDGQVQLLQLQGAKSRVSYRVASGMKWSVFLADETVAIAGEIGARRIAMEHPLQIQGLVEARSERAFSYYETFVAIARLQWSEVERLFVRDLG